MRLYELEGPEPILPRLVAAMNQLKSGMERGKLKKNLSVDELLTFLHDNDVSLDKSMLYDMIKTPPLDSFISNIQGDNVVFKGQESNAEEYDDKSDDQETVEKMAKSAMK